MSARRSIDDMAALHNGRLHRGGGGAGEMPPARTPESASKYWRCDDCDAEDPADDFAIGTTDLCVHCRGKATVVASEPAGGCGHSGCDGQPSAPVDAAEIWRTLPRAQRVLLLQPYAYNSVAPRARGTYARMLGRAIKAGLFEPLGLLGLEETLHEIPKLTPKGERVAAYGSAQKAGK